jgi:hypothetical protein
MESLRRNGWLAGISMIARPYGEPVRVIRRRTRANRSGAIAGWTTPRADWVALRDACERHEARAQRALFWFMDRLRKRDLSVYRRNGYTLVLQKDPSQT